MANDDLIPRRVRGPDLTGQTFERWTVLSYGGNGRWTCRCACGHVGLVDTGGLLRGRSRQCVKCRCRTAGPKNYKARHFHPVEHYLWRAMNNRCCDPKNKAYDRYGGRGITVCDRWRNSFTAFLEDMGSRPRKGLSLDRIDNEGPYSPENCRWATPQQQGRNTRVNRLITYNGRTQCLQAWSEEMNISYKVLGYRIRSGWNAADALTVPVGLPLREKYRKFRG